jgi:hypothetical protein
MFHARSLALVSALAIAAPAVTLSAREQWGVPRDQYGYNNQYGYSEGYNRGLRAGEEDARRNQSFNYTDESDYRDDDAGYRSQYGDRTSYRADFRRGFEEGYRAGFGRSTTGRYGNRGDNLPPQSNGRGWANGRAGRDDNDNYNSYNRVALESGFNDGYEAGMSDGRARRRNDPIAESRYRSGDRGYNSRYGTRDAYKVDYRRAFLQGYDRGYDDGRRNNNGGPSRWWPF